MKLISKKLHASSFLRYLLIYLLLGLILIFFLFPLFWMLITSFQVSGINFTGENYQKIFQDAPIWDYIRNTFIISVGSTLLSLILGVPAGFRLARTPGWISQLLALMMLGIRMFPPVSLLIPFYLLMRDLRLIDTYLGLILLQSVFKITFVAWFMRGFYTLLPADMEEAAQVDGCTQLGAFWRVALPLSLPGLITTTIFGFIFSWNDFFAALLLSGVNTRVLTLGILESFNTYEIDWGRMTAFSVITILPIVLLAFGLQRYYIQGLTSGAVRD